MCENIGKIFISGLKILGKFESSNLNITKVKGPEYSCIGAMLTYSVTHFSIKVTETTRMKVKWEVKIDDKIIPLEQLKEMKMVSNASRVSLSFIALEEWVNKSIIVTPSISGVKNPKNQKTQTRVITHITKLPDEACIWIEVIGTGHVFATVRHNDIVTVYTYGRYDDVKWYQTHGEGVLIRSCDDWSINYILGALYEKNADVFRINTINIKKIKTYFDNLFTQSSEKPDKEEYKEIGRVVDDYILFSNNCTTTTIKAFAESNTDIFDNDNNKYKIPSSLLDYLESLSEKREEVDKITCEMKERYKNINNQSTKNTGYRSQSSGIIGGSSGSTANSSNEGGSSGSNGSSK